MKYFLLLIIAISGIFTSNVNAEKICKDQKFLVTAYYSPLPNQEFYMRGSHQNDIILNGRGTNGADGTEVYMGMIAAPKTYKFGSKVYMGKIGIGTVHDRGGAIIKRSNYDRIDIWMGKGEKGLSRALNWGIRFVEGKICSGDSTKDTIDYFQVSDELPKIVKDRLLKKTKYFSKKYKLNKKYKPSKKFIKKKYKKIENFDFVKIPNNFGEGASGEKVVILQMILKNIGFYKGVLTGNYDLNTIEGVFNFQRETGVVKRFGDAGAGYFGKKTKKSLEKFLNKLHKEIKFIDEKKEGKILKFGEKVEKKISIKKPVNKKKVSISKTQIKSFFDNLSVKEIQEILKKGKTINLKKKTVIAKFSKKINQSKNQILKFD